MKTLLILAAATLGLASLQAQEKPLSVTERELLLERLQEIQETSNSTVKGRYTVALTAFKEGIKNDAAAHDLYLKCIEKVRFLDEAKKTSEFREWKRRHSEGTDNAEFRLALRHQLNWLVLTLEAAQDKKEKETMGPRCMAVLDAILKDADDLKDNRALLRSKPTESIFAEAYGVDALNLGEWPESPLDIGGVYDLVVLPPFRTPETLTQLQSGWKKRIEHEGLILEGFANEGSADKDLKPAFEKWKLEGRNDLIWTMEVDLFSNGDEKGAALRMLEHLKENLKHKSAPKWIKQFTSLVKGEAPVPEEE